MEIFLIMDAILQLTVRLIAVLPLIAHPWVAPLALMAALLLIAVLLLPVALLHAVVIRFWRCPILRSVILWVLATRLASLFCFQEVLVCCIGATQVFQFPRSRSKMVLFYLPMNLRHLQCLFPTKMWRFPHQSVRKYFLTSKR